MIDAHPLKEQIKQVQRESYRGASLIHKNGLDAASFVLGPLGFMGFAATDNGMKKSREKAKSSLEDLMAKLDYSRP